MQSLAIYGVICSNFKCDPSMVTTEDITESNCGRYNERTRMHGVIHKIDRFC